MRKLAGLVAAALIVLVPGVAGAQRPGASVASPPVGMASGVLIELGSGKVLWAKDEGSQRAPASVTKILTALVVLEHAKLTDKVTITPEARAAPGSRIFAEAGWTFSVEDLLWGLMLQSGNDAAVALAQKVSPDGSVGGFVNLMNERARQIGATGTHFVNPHGYDEPGHVTSAQDLALLTMAAMRNRKFAEIVTSKTHDVTWGDGQPHTFINHNKMLWRYPGTIGVKTGYTDDAGHTLVTAVRRNGTTLVAVTLASPEPYKESMALYDWAFANLTALRAAPIERLTPGGAAPVAASKKTSAGARRPSSRLPEIVEIPMSRVSASPPGPPVPIFIAVALLAAGMGAVYTRRRLRADGDEVIAPPPGPGEPLEGPLGPAPEERLRGPLQEELDPAPASL
jgi:D-alanyl-D-alanine carboxypeptidase